MSATTVAKRNKSETLQNIHCLLHYRDNEDFSVDQVSKMRQIFRESLPPDKTSLTLDEFKKIMPNKNVRPVSFWIKNVQR